MDDVALLGFLDTRARIIGDECQRRETEITPLVADFRQRLIKAVREQHLPVALDAALYKLDATRLIYADPLALLPGSGGEAQTAERLARISLRSAVQGKLRTRVFHELTHMVAGVEPVAHGTTQVPAVNMRSGVGVISGSGRSSLSWLNEAITTVVADSLQEDGVDFAAITASDLLAKAAKRSAYQLQSTYMVSTMLGPKGNVPLYSFLGAYFEDYDPTLPDGDRSPWHNELFDQWSGAWGNFGNIRNDVYVGDIFDFNQAHANTLGDSFTAALGRLERVRTQQSDVL